MLILYDKYFAAWATTVALLGSVCMSPVKSAPPCGCKLTGLLCSICKAGSWTALEGLAGCAGRQTVPDKPGRKTRQREVHFELVRFKRLTVWLWLADQLNNEWSTEEEKNQGMQPNLANGPAPRAETTLPWLYVFSISASKPIFVKCTEGEGRVERIY